MIETNKKNVGIVITVNCVSAVDKTRLLQWHMQAADK